MVGVKAPSKAAGPCSRRKASTGNWLVSSHLAMLFSLNVFVTLFYDVAILSPWAGSLLHWGILFSLLIIVSSVLSAIYFYTHVG